MYDVKAMYRRMYMTVAVPVILLYVIFLAGCGTTSTSSTPPPPPQSSGAPQISSVSAAPSLNGDRKSVV